MRNLIDKNVVIDYSSDNCNRLSNMDRRIRKGDDREEYTISAVRERGRKLEDPFGEELWKVALEPAC